MLPWPPHWNLEDAAGAQRGGEPLPQPLVVGDPVQRRRRDDHVDRLVEDQVEHILAPDPSAIPQTLAGQLDHLLRGVDGKDTPIRSELEDTFGDSACSTPNVEHRRACGKTAGDSLKNR